jgi:predicted ATPase/class 3 adenylate cyclase/tetratricopeptide (TPR) repeat protein
MSEIRALLLTDVVDSTQLTQTLGEADLAALWVSHDRLARDLLPQCRGREIDKTDGMLLLFEAACDAVDYAVAYHRALARLSPPLKARAGLHVGAVMLRENSQTDVARGAKPIEVEGMAKAMAARVMSIANGGQTLLSADARHAVTADTLRLESHGHWRLKGIAEPIELFEIGDSDAPFVPPPDAYKAYRVVREGDIWLPVRDIKHSLPAERDSFVGRRETLTELAHRVDAGAREVSVVGIGGSGKTRLVTRFGWIWLGDFPGGVWFCDLSQARSLDGVVHAVAQGFDVPLGKDDPVNQLGHAIARRGQCLVILDNFEQVSRYAEETLGQWLNRASDARFLVTTREVLGLNGEEVLGVAPMQTSDAITLFLRRASAAKPDFQPSAEDHAAIAPLVELLDRLPLAVELAAARVRVMPPRTLLARMGDRFALLSGSRHGRQATLRTVLDWSWDLLSLPEKMSLAQLSVFEGGFTLESVEAVLDLSDCENAPLPMDTLQSLVQKSFVRPVPGERFDLLVSVKEYAAEHLGTEGRYPGSGPSALRAAVVRHGRYFAGLDEKIATVGGGVELGNFITACRRAVARGEADVAVSALERAWAVLRLRGPFRAGVELASVVRAIPGLQAEPVARVEWVAGRALADCGMGHEAYAHFEASLVCAREAGAKRSECRSLIGMADRDIHAGRGEAARPLLEAALFVARETGDRNLESRAQNSLGNLEEALGRLSEALAHYEAALPLAREVGDFDSEGSILGNLGNLCHSLGSVEVGRQHMEAALAVAQKVGNRRLEGNTFCNLGLLHLVHGRLEEARGQLGASLAVARDLGHALLECIVLCNLGIVYDGLAQPDKAREDFEAALDIARELADRRSEGQILGYLGLLHARQVRVEAARSCLDMGETLLRAVYDRLSLGILLCCRTEAEHLAGHPSEAKATLAQAQAIADALEAGPESELGLAITRLQDLVRMA